MPPACGGCGHVSSEFWQFEPTAVTSSAAELHIKKLFSVVCGRERRTNLPIDPAPCMKSLLLRQWPRYEGMVDFVVELLTRINYEYFCTWMCKQKEFVTI